MLKDFGVGMNRWTRVLWYVLMRVGTYGRNEGEQVLSNCRDAVGTCRSPAFTDPAFVASGAIPWLLLRVVGSELGPDFGDRLAGTVFIRRVNTSGGVAPTAGSAKKEAVGKKALVSYTTDDIFYR